LDLEIFNGLINNIKKSDFMQNFIKELGNFLENNNNSNIVNETNKYSNYWDYQNFMEDNVAANIGISRWSADIRYHDELSNAIDNSILKLSENEGTLYRKQFMANGPTDNQTYSIDKYENGKIEHLILSADKVPKGFENEDIIFQYKPNGTPKVRNDLKEKIIKNAILETENLKEEELKKATDYKKEGHIYKAIEDDGYIFLKDITEERNYVLEDIDFTVDCYEGEGEYKVIDGVYKKISK
jgi:hypothetical protein